MSILMAVGMGLSITQGVLGFSQAQKQKKQAKEQAKKQRELAKKEFKINSKILQENFVNNALVNYDTTAKKMGELTTNYTRARSEALVSTKSYFSGNVSFNSNRSDTENSLKMDFNTKVFEFINERDYNEETLKRDFKNNYLNLQTRYEQNLFGIDSAENNAKMASDQKSMNSILGTATNLVNMFAFSNVGNNQKQNNNQKNNKGGK